MSINISLVRGIPVIILYHNSSITAVPLCVFHHTVIVWDRHGGSSTNKNYKLVVSYNNHLFPIRFTTTWTTFIPPVVDGSV